jgi:hypothetical protein
MCNVKILFIKRNTLEGVIVMKLFKSLKRKAGNAIIPVVGTILGLTILAGTIVGVALNSSQIVYHEKNIQKQQDARQILYVASKYFCKGLNEGKKDTELRDELQSIFGKGLKVTQDGENYYIWYPNKFADISRTEMMILKDQNK